MNSSEIWNALVWKNLISLRDEDTDSMGIINFVMETCAKIALDERVDFDDTQCPEDKAYNTACEHVAEAIMRAREG